MLSMGASVQECATPVIEDVQPDSLDEIIISSELTVRPTQERKYSRGNGGDGLIARVDPQGKHVALKTLAGLAIVLCEAGSAGVIVLDQSINGDRVSASGGTAAVPIEAIEWLMTPFGYELPRVKHY
jgi:hypothetical protein